MSSGCLRPGLGKLWSCLRTAGATPVGCASVEKMRVAEGIPAYGIDMVERDLPQETSQMRALHFNKGCYLGQEIVERIRSRGNVHRHLRPLELNGSGAGERDGIFQEDGTPAGQIHERGGVAAGSGQSRFRAGNGARGGGSAEPDIHLHIRNRQGLGEHSG